MRRKLACLSVFLVLLCGCNGGNAHSSGISEPSAAISGSEIITETTTAAGSVTPQSTAGTTSAAVSKDTDRLSEYPRDIIRENGCVVGMAYVGYIDSELNESGIREFLENSETFENYGCLNNADIVLREGAELYALIPLESYSLTVFSSELTEEGENAADRTAPLYQGEPGESIVLRCNLSEIYSNVLVSVSNGFDTVEFQPMLSMMDGRMVTPDKCLDLSIYKGTGVDLVNYAFESLLSNFEIQDYIELGMVLRCTNEIVDIGEGQQGLLFALGTDRDDQFVNEKYYAFDTESGIKYYLDPATAEWEVLAEG